MKNIMTQREHDVWVLAYELKYQQMTLHGDVNEKAIASAKAALTDYRRMRRAKVKVKF